MNCNDWTYYQTSLIGSQKSRIYMIIHTTEYMEYMGWLSSFLLMKKCSMYNYLLKRSLQRLDYHYADFYCVVGEVDVIM